MTSSVANNTHMARIVIVFVVGFLVCLGQNDEMRVSREFF